MPLYIWIQARHETLGTLRDMDINDNSERHNGVLVWGKMTIGSGCRSGCGGVGVVEDDNRKWPSTGMWRWWLCGRRQ